MSSSPRCELSNFTEDAGLLFFCLGREGFQTGDGLVEVLLQAFLGENMLLVLGLEQFACCFQVREETLLNEAVDVPELLVNFNDFFLRHLGSQAHEALAQLTEVALDVGDVLLQGWDGLVEVGNNLLGRHHHRQ